MGTRGGGVVDGQLEIARIFECGRQVGHHFEGIHLPDFGRFDGHGFLGAAGGEEKQGTTEAQQISVHSLGVM